MIVSDFHSHILPQTDDGSDSCAQSIAMLRLEAEQGITRVVATPHFYPGHDSLEHFLHRRDRAFAQLSKEAACDAALPQVLLGAEVYYFPGMSQSDRLAELAIDGKNGILIEMPPPPWTEDMYTELEQIRTLRGLVPILAHIDRYISPLRTCGILPRLRELPLLVQANARFFLRAGTAAMALHLLKTQQIHLLGSDCHDMTSRKPDLGPALKRIESRLGDDPLKRIAHCEAQLLTRPDHTERFEFP